MLLRRASSSAGPYPRPSDAFPRATARIIFISSIPLTTLQASSGEPTTYHSEISGGTVYSAPLAAETPIVHNVHICATLPDLSHGPR